MKFELEPDNRGRPDDELLADLRAVAQKVSTGSPTRDQYDELGRFSAATLGRRFGSWNKALREAGLATGLEHSITPDALLADMKRVAGMLGTTAITAVEYDKHGVHSAASAKRRFGDWNKAVKAAGLEPGFNTQISNEDLFENLERVWRHIGRQPRLEEVASPLSKYSAHTYSRRFGGWRKSLEAFVAAIGDVLTVQQQPSAHTPSPSDTAPIQVRVHKTPRTVNWRLRFLTLRRDGFRCNACGRSPATELGVELEVDHVIPWSDFGETVLENLQSLCEKCNGGKSNLPFTTP